MGIFDSLFGKGSTPDPIKLNDYPSLLESSKKNPASINFTSLRKAFLASPLYQPYGRTNNDAFAALDLLKADQPAQAVTAITACLDKYYLDLDAHLSASIIYHKLGEYSKFSFHNNFTQGLIKAILDTGNGKSFENAYVVIDIPEEYSIMNVLGLKQVKRKTVINSNRKFDVHQVIDKNGNTFELYFNVDFSASVPMTTPAVATSVSETSAAQKTSETLLTVLKIGSREWMTRNLNADRFINGDIIPEAKTKEDWIKAGREGKPAWCYHDNDPSQANEHGKLYNWFAVSDPKGLLPKGWRVPGQDDWLELINGFGGMGSAGMSLKSSSGWNNNGNGTNQSGFNGRPSGGRIFENESSVFAAMFTGLGQVASWWSLEESTKEKAWSYSLVSIGMGVARLESSKVAGCSVRGVRSGEKPVPAKEIVATIYFSSNKVISENSLKESAKPLASIGKIIWSDKSSDSQPDTADGQSYFYIEQSEAKGAFLFSYTLRWRALTLLPDKRQQVEFLKRLSFLQEAEILTHAGGSDPYNFIYLQPGLEAALVGIDAEADNDDELKIEAFVSTGWGIFALPNVLTPQQEEWIARNYHKYFSEVTLRPIAPDLINHHFIEGQLDLIDLQPFVHHYLVLPGKSNWYSDDEKSIVMIQIFEEFQKTFNVPVCVFPVNSSVIANIPGGSDSEQHCILIRENRSQKIIYKTRRNSWK